MNANPEFHHLLTVDTDLCIGCAHCIRHCPTKALRIRTGKASLRKDWCVDCGECLKVCPVRAIFVEQDDFDRIFDYKCRAVLFPSSFLGQFAENYSEGDILGVLGTLGFTHTFPVELTVDVIREQMAAGIASADRDDKPQISPFCPAVVRLIQTKFPDLVGNIMNLRTPVESTAMLARSRMLGAGYDANEIGIFYITPCAAKAASVKDANSATPLIDGILNMDSLYNKVSKILNGKKENAPLPQPEGRPLRVSQRNMRWCTTSGEASSFGGRCLSVDGIDHVKDFLERMETTGDINDIDFLELRACHRGCMGGALTPVNRFLAEERLRNRTKLHPLLTEAHSAPTNEEAQYLISNMRVPRIRPMTKLLFQGDIHEVLNSMDAARKIRAILPGLDCGACGSPTCESLSHDIVRGEAKLTNCIFMHSDNSEGSILEQLENVWGAERFKHDQKPH